MFNILKLFSGCTFYSCQTKTIPTNVANPISWSDTKSFIPPINGGTVIKVYDGDTITIATKLPYNNSELYRFSVRLKGIDSAEIKSSSIDEQNIAKEAKQCLTNLILNKYVSLQNLNTEKYGRILADVYLGEIHVNQWMLHQHLAVEYDGGTKKPPSSWIRYRLTGEK
jgi:endonuclease YncB( thermonuclease family)